MRRWWVLLVWPACGCAGPELRGAEVVFPGTEPAGEVVTDYPFVACEDAAGRKLPTHRMRVQVVRTEEGLRVVERRAGYESLVVTNRFEREGASVFQAIVESASGRPRLRQYRVPSEGAATLVVAEDYSMEEQADGSDAGFVGHIHQLVLSCTLSPVFRKEETASVAGKSAIAHRGRIEETVMVRLPR